MADQDFTFKAGQFITIKIDDASPPCFRGYSVGSAPRTDNTFDLCIKAIPGGRGSNWLNSLRKDDKFIFMGPFGEFVFTTPPEKTALFIATGTGIAPFVSIVKDQLSKGYKGPLHILHGVRYEKDIFYREMFEELAEKHPNFTYDITLSRPDEGWDRLDGWVTDNLEKWDLPNTEAYICGLTEMINGTIKVLKEKGLTDEEIHFEKFD